MDLLYTVKETSQILKVNINKVYELIDKGYIKAMKLGRYKIRRTELERFVEEFEGKDLTDLDHIKILGEESEC